MITRNEKKTEQNAEVAKVCRGSWWQLTPAVQNSGHFAVSNSEVSCFHSALTRWARIMLAHSACSLAAAGSLLLGAAEGASLVAGGGGDLDVLLGRDTDHVGWDVDHLLGDSDVLLSDQDAGMMDRGSEVSLHDEGLQTAFHELGDVQTQDEIELLLLLREETHSDHTAEEGFT